MIFGAELCKNRNKLSILIRIEFQIQPFFVMENYHIFFSYKSMFFPIQNNLKDLDLSCKTDVDLLGLFWKRQTHFIVALHKMDLHICCNFVRVILTL